MTNVSHFYSFLQICSHAGYENGNMNIQCALPKAKHTVTDSIGKQQKNISSIFPFV